MTEDEISNQTLIHILYGLPHERAANHTMFLFLCESHLVTIRVFELDKLYA
jgi:hypothetical protein